MLPTGTAANLPGAKAAVETRTAVLLRCFSVSRFEWLVRQLRFRYSVVVKGLVTNFWVNCCTTGAKFTRRVCDAQDRDPDGRCCADVGPGRTSDGGSDELGRGTGTGR